MAVVTGSPKFQVVIPKDVREALGIRPGQKVQAFAVGERVELIPVDRIRNLRGFLNGAVPDLERESDRLWTSSTDVLVDAAESVGLDGARARARAVVEDRANRKPSTTTGSAPRDGREETL